MMEGVFSYLAERANKRGRINGKNLIEPDFRRDYIPSYFP
jgi:hypothetical protein